MAQEALGEWLVKRSEANGAIIIDFDDFLTSEIREQFKKMSITPNVDQAGRIIGYTVRLWPRRLPEKSPKVERRGHGRPTRRRPKSCTVEETDVQKA